MWIYFIITYLLFVGNGRQENFTINFGQIWGLVHIFQKCDMILERVKKYQIFLKSVWMMIPQYLFARRSENDTFESAIVVSEKIERSSAQALQYHVLPYVSCIWTVT